jgi:hypothetical protein
MGSLPEPAIQRRGFMHLSIFGKNVKVYMSERQGGIHNIILYSAPVSRKDLFASPDPMRFHAFRR